MRAPHPDESRHARLPSAGDERRLEPILALYDAGGRRATSTKASSRAALILASPKFLFRTESARSKRKTGLRLNGQLTVELASRLSFFLWSSIPDEELLNVASKGTLSQPTMLERQVKRMLADPKSRRARRQLREPVADAA
jgi:hypothetical protein